MKDTKYIFVVGGVMSGVGKGVVSSSVGKLLQSRGFTVSSIKIDPYVNVDAGTMNPTEHGEVFVLDDGTECDMDMGNYERFLDKSFDKENYMTTGSVYLSVINKERNLEYKGKCVGVVPDIPKEIISKVKRAGEKDNADFVITEIGGTLGEYQNVLFLEAIRMMKIEMPKKVKTILVSFLPFQTKGGGELKTKPTQHAVRDMSYTGLHPDFIIARAKTKIDEKRRKKISFHCNVNEKDIISAPDVESIYDVPINFDNFGFTDRILEKFGLEPKKKDLDDWINFAEKYHKSNEEVVIGIVGKYFETGDYVLSDSYVSVIESIKHAAYANDKKPVIKWLSSDKYEGDNLNENLKEIDDCDGIIVPGGFGARGVEGKINVIRYARENKIPFLGLCYGMQLMLIEFARNVCGMKEANTTEINESTEYPLVYLMPEQNEAMEQGVYGATMRLGAYPAVLKRGTVAYNAYEKSNRFIEDNEFNLDKDQKLISERHRHRYEVNPKYIEKIEDEGLVFSGFSPDKKLMEIVELPKEKHPFFVASQFHPEFKSHPLSPHPLFIEFIKSIDSK
jgi:CTP synthase